MNLVQPLSTGSASKPFRLSSNVSVLHYAESVVWTRRERERGSLKKYIFGISSVMFFHILVVYKHVFVSYFYG